MLPETSVPVAYDSLVTIEKNASATIALSGIDPEGDPIGFSIVHGPDNGQLVGSAPSFTYHPALDFVGTDRLRFTASDGFHTSREATATIVVIDPCAEFGGDDDSDGFCNTVDQCPQDSANSCHTPVAQNLVATTVQNASVMVTLQATDPDNDPLGYVVASLPTEGTLSGLAPNLTYSPSSGYMGPDTFTYTAGDGTNTSETATVTITVAPADCSAAGGDSDLDGVCNDDEDDDGDGIPNGGDSCPQQSANTCHTPTAQDIAAYTSQNLPVIVVLQGDDPQDDPLTYLIETQPSHGALSGVAPNLTYSPFSGYMGPDMFTYTATDGNHDSAPATVTITIAAADCSTAGGDSDLDGLCNDSEDDDGDNIPNAEDECPQDASNVCQINAVFGDGFED